MPATARVLFTGRGASVGASEVMVSALAPLLHLAPASPGAAWPIPLAWDPLMVTPVQTSLYM